jgi:two-component system chemotaxis sensor kinase CheA
MSNPEQMDDGTKAMVSEFVIESLDSLDKTESLIESLSQEGNLENVNTVFRTFHTIKGLSGFFGFNVTNRLTHEAETLLDKLRKQNKPQNEETITIIYQTFDFLRYLLQVIASEYDDSFMQEEAENMAVIIRDMIAKVDSLASENAIAETKSDSSIELSDKSNTESKFEIDDNLTSLITGEMFEQYISNSMELVELSEDYLIKLEKEPDNEVYIGETFGMIHSLKGNSGFMGFTEIEEFAMDAETILDSLRSKELEADQGIISILLSFTEQIKTRLNELLRKSTNSNEIKGKSEEQLDTKKVEEIPLEDFNFVQTEVKEVKSNSSSSVQTKPKITVKKEIPSAQPTQRTDIRVETSKIDKLFDLVGELITIESMLTNSPDLKGLELPNFNKTSTMLNKITRELQEISMSVRMMPIESLFNKMKRLVRDVSLKMNKKVELYVKGSETEVDKNVIDEIADPLVHILRNAIDHGVELPKVRLENGKEEKGIINLEAKYEGNEILIVIEDDGAGINKERVLEKAIEKGLVNEENKLSDREIYLLIFEAGFSTAKEVTDISGRGVGMDVVKKNIEKLQGTIDVDSVYGYGSRFTLRIPLTLAIMEAMLIRIGKSSYALPILSLRESFKCNKDMITKTMDGLELVKIRNEVIPVIRLHEVFNIEPASNTLEDGILMVIESRSKKVCFFVDEILGQQQAVVKGIGDYIGKVNGITGCMILGDGSVGLIIDVEGIISMSEIDVSINLN